MVKHKRVLVFYKTTSKVKWYFKSGVAPLYHSLVTSLCNNAFSWKIHTSLLQGLGFDIDYLLLGEVVLHAGIQHWIILSCYGKWCMTRQYKLVIWQCGEHKVTQLVVYGTCMFMRKLVVLWCEKNPMSLRWWCLVCLGASWWACSVISVLGR